jgi:hypothetical protein
MPNLKPPNLKSWTPLAALILLSALPTALRAQWPDYKLARAPRTPDGKIDLNAPAPNTADGTPDLSGIWNNSRVGRAPQATAAGRGGAANGGGAGRGGGANAPANANNGAPPTPAGFPTAPSGIAGDPLPPAPADLADSGPPLATFFNVGQNLKGGVPLKPAAAALLKSRMEEHSKDNPDAHCLPLGLMQLHLHPQPRKIVQTPAVTMILYEAQAGIRSIFTDGRPLPPADVLPWWYGYSIGHWEGDTLVVETTGFRDDVWLDVNGTPLTNTGKMTERFRRLNYGNLEIIITIEDPSVFTAPYTVRVTQRLMPDTELIEFICQENDRSGPHLVGK